MNWPMVVLGVANFATGALWGSWYLDRYHRQRNARVAKVVRWLITQSPDSRGLEAIATDLEQS